MGLLVGPVTITGDGSIVLAGGAVNQIFEIDTQIVVDGHHLQRFSPDPIGKLAHAGWIGLSVVGSLPPYTANIDQVNWFTFLNFSNEAFGPSVQGGGVYADTLWYHLEDTQVTIAVYD